MTGKIWKKGLTIALNVLYVEKMDISPAYVSKHNSNREKEIIFLMILNEKEAHYFVVKNRLLYWWFLLFELSSFLEQKTSLKKQGLQKTRLL